MLRSMARMSRKAGAADPAVTRDTAENVANAGRLKQIRMVAGLIRKSNPKAMPIIIGSGLGVLVILVVVGLLTGLGSFLIPLGVLLGLLAGVGWLYVLRGLGWLGRSVARRFGLGRRRGWLGGRFRFWLFRHRLCWLLVLPTATQNDSDREQDRSQSGDIIF